MNAKVVVMLSISIALAILAFMIYIDWPYLV
jgi:hypothetical protein